MAAKFEYKDEVKVITDRQQSVIGSIGRVDKILACDWNTDKFHYKYCLSGVVKYGWYNEDQLELVTKNTENES